MEPIVPPSTTSSLDLKSQTPNAVGSGETVYPPEKFIHNIHHKFYEWWNGFNTPNGLLMGGVCISLWHLLPHFLQYTLNFQNRILNTTIGFIYTINQLVWNKLAQININKISGTYTSTVILFGKKQYKFQYRPRDTFLEELRN